MNFDSIQSAADALRTRSGGRRHRVAAVLGSGLSSYAEHLPGAIAIPYEDIPGFPVPRVQGHAGTAYSVELDGVPVLILAGRAHFYEGHSLEQVVFAVRASIAAGATTIMLTNASGGCGDGFKPGDLVLLRDHLNLTGQNPLFGPNDDRLGPRFPDLTAAYDPDLRATAHSVARQVQVDLREGVYAWFTGPSYETPAEVQMARRMGADMVGMSTVPETIAARHMGARVIAISLVTNLAAGISGVPLSHEEVQETAEAARDRFTRLVDSLLPRLA
ncbi:MAG: purine-nucleoside phosphorylase [Acidimicrobiia bacterium]|nr:purine-nucleoside phosphorylase [Acidimicrobiia bacterium]